MKIIDLNADLGEGIAWEPELLPLISSANICCGAHAGSPEITRATVEECLARNIRIGAHPGYPDPENFGRNPLRSLGMDTQDVLQSLIRQVNIIPEATYVKPHGALYNESSTEWGGSNQATKESEDERYSQVPTEPYVAPTPEEMFAVMEEFDRHVEDNPKEVTDDAKISASFILTGMFVKFRLPLMGLPGTYHEKLAWFTHAPLIREGFIDRRYGDNHRLIPRSNPDALIHDPQEAINQAIRLAYSCDSLCIHGDNPEAPKLLAQVRQALIAEGFTISQK